VLAVACCAGGVVLLLVLAVVGLFGVVVVGVDFAGPPAAGEMDGLAEAMEEVEPDAAGVAG
jgi:hypothetical protein